MGVTSQVMAAVGQVEALVAEREVGDLLVAQRQRQSDPVVEGRIHDLVVGESAPRRRSGPRGRSRRASPRPATPRRDLPPAGRGPRARDPAGSALSWSKMNASGALDLQPAHVGAREDVCRCATTTRGYGRSGRCRRGMDPHVALDAARARRHADQAEFQRGLARDRPAFSNRARTEAASQSSSTALVTSARAWVRRSASCSRRAGSRSNSTPPGRTSRGRSGSRRAGRSGSGNRRGCGRNRRPSAGSRRRPRARRGRRCDSPAVPVRARWPAALRPRRDAGACQGLDRLGSTAVAWPMVVSPASVSNPVGLGHGRAVAFPVDGEAGRPEVAQRELARLTGESQPPPPAGGEGPLVRLGSLVRVRRSWDPSSKATVGSPRRRRKSRLKGRPGRSILRGWIGLADRARIACRTAGRLRRASRWSSQALQSRPARPGRRRSRKDAPAKWCRRGRRCPVPRSARCSRPTTSGTPTSPSCRSTGTARPGWRTWTPPATCIQTSGPTRAATPTGSPGRSSTRRPRPSST